MGERNGFYEDDEPVEEVLQAFEHGEKHLTEAPVLGSRTEYLKLPAFASHMESSRGRTTFLQLRGWRLLKPTTGRPTSTTPELQS
jgi:hypothetical protein